MGRGCAQGLDTVLILAHGFGHWSPERVGSYTGLIFNVEDMASTYETLRAKGVTFKGEPDSQPYGTDVEAQDPDGNVFTLHDPARTLQSREAAR